MTRLLDPRDDGPKSGAVTTPRSYASSLPTATGISNTLNSVLALSTRCWPRAILRASTRPGVETVIRLPVCEDIP